MIVNDKVLLPYRFTLFSNTHRSTGEAQNVLLPYRFTLFSNALTKFINFIKVLLPYRFTLFSNEVDGSKLNEAVLLPYRFTLFSNDMSDTYNALEFYYLIDLHYSQTVLVLFFCRQCFTTL